MLGLGISKLRIPEFGLRSNP